MRNKKPPFEITNAMIDHVTEIAELVGRLTSTNQLSANSTLRRTNRIRTIHGSLAIEQNTLTLEQVTAVLNGKQVLAPPKDIAEVKNAYEIYERLDELNPFSVAVLSFHCLLIGSSFPSVNLLTDNLLRSESFPVYDFTTMKAQCK